jgi:hypothetical protein
MALELPSTGSKLQSSARVPPAVLTSKNLSIIVVGAVLIVAIIKAESKDIPLIVQTLVESHVWATTGWVFAGVILITAVVVIRVLLNLYQKEINRIARERDELQKILLDRQAK